ncbi:hypothetical protein D3C84_1082960 [compost metagenome]
MLLTKRNSFSHKANPRIWLYTAQFKKLDILLTQGLNDSIIKAALFNASPSVMQKKLLAVHNRFLSCQLLFILTEY